MRPTKRRMFAIHGWIGMQLGLLLFLVLFTGTLATLAHEIDWLVTPALRVPPTAERAPWAQVIAAALAARADVQPLYLTAGAGPRFADTLVVRTAAGELRRIFVDPYAARVTGEAAWLSVQRFLQDFHRWLFVPRAGIYLVTILAVPLLMSMITALVFYRRWWRGFFRLRRDHGPRVFWSDLHRLTGAWSLWFVLVIGVTGVWYLAERLASDAGHRVLDTPTATPPVERDGLAQYGPFLPASDFVRLEAATQDAFPDFSIRGVIFPQRPNDPIVFVGQARAWLVRDRANRVALHPRTAEVLALQRAETLPALHYWLHMADPLHFGDFGGIASKLVWFVFGLGLSGMVLTGAYLCGMRAMTAADPARAQRAKRYAQQPAGDPLNIATVDARE